MYGREDLHRGKYIKPEALGEECKELGPLRNPLL